MSIRRLIRWHCLRDFVMTVILEVEYRPQMRPKGLSNFTSHWATVSFLTNSFQSFVCYVYRHCLSRKISKLFGKRILWWIPEQQIKWPIINSLYRSSAGFNFIRRNGVEKTARRSNLPWKLGTQPCSCSRCHCWHLREFPVEFSHIGFLTDMINLKPCPDAPRVHNEKKKYLSYNGARLNKVGRKNQRAVLSQSGICGYILCGAPFISELFFCSSMEII